MKIFKNLFKRKRKRVFPPESKLTEAAQNKGLDFTDCKAINVLVSADKTRRCVILSSEKGFLTYRFEKLNFYDEDELAYLTEGSLPVYWHQINGCKRVFGNLEELYKELYAEPEYKNFFKN